MAVEKEVLNLNAFKNPSKENSVIYGWFWSYAITEEEIDKMLFSFKEADISGFYIIPMPQNFRPNTIRTFMEPEYLSEEFFCLIKYALKKATEQGLECWIYDEGGWPSGGACGLTAKQNSEAVETVLKRRNVSLKSGEKYCADSDVIAVFNGRKQLPKEFVSQEDTEIAEYFAFKMNDNHPNRVDSTNRSVTETFINNTYEAYNKHLGDMFGKDIPIMFNDEPPVINNLLPKDFFGVFKEKYGYDAKDYLYCIFDVDLCVSEEEQKARIDYGKLVGELCVENYFKPITKWCKEKNLAFGGHLDIDHRPDSCGMHSYYSSLNVLRHFDVPGIDVIWEQIRYPYENRSIMEEGIEFYPRIAASAARQTGKNLTLTESFGVYGDGLTPDEIRFVLNFQAVRGINCFNIFGLSSNKGFCSMQERPVFITEKPGYFGLEHINKYFKRMSYLARLGESVCDTALYCPYADFWATKEIRETAANNYKILGEELEAKNISFDIIDDYGIQNAIVTPKGLKLGNAVYKHIYFPECKFLPEHLKEKAKPFITNAKPLIENLPNGLNTMARKLENGTLYFIFNKKLETIKAELDIKADYLYSLNLLSGEIISTDKAEVNLVCGDMAVILASDKKFEAKQIKDSELTEITGFIPVSATLSTFSEKGVEKQSANVDELNENSSCEITYKASYTLPESFENGENCYLRLEDFGVYAKVAINGEIKGTLGMKPAVLKLDNIAKSGEIEITLSNTFANEIISKHDYILTLPEALVGPYDRRCIKFEARKPKLNLGKVYIEKIKVI